MEFYFSHLLYWLGELEVPLFISRNRLVKCRTLPKARKAWALDSGFTELAKCGYWHSSPEEYAQDTRRFRDAIEQMSWASMDWMCEPWVVHGGDHGGQVFAGTRVARNLAPDEPDDLDLPFVSVLQGRSLQDYEHRARMYAEAGIQLKDEPLVGLGSVCRRQGNPRDRRDRQPLRRAGPVPPRPRSQDHRCRRYGHLLTSADSMAWSAGARRRPRLPECTHRAQTCVNCPRYALLWRTKVLFALAARRPANHHPPSRLHDLSGALQ